jgi:hypothetical protein
MIGSQRLMTSNALKGSISSLFVTSPLSFCFQIYNFYQLSFITMHHDVDIIDFIYIIQCTSNTIIHLEHNNYYTNILSIYSFIYKKKSLINKHFKF